MAFITGAEYLKPKAVPVPVRLARESIATVIDEIQPLLEAHWREIAQYPDIPLDPNFDQYRLAETCGQLRIFTVRLEERLVGYAIYLLSPALHYSKSLQAKQDVLYLMPEHRTGRMGRRLIEFADEHLQRDRVQVVYQHMKPAHDFSPLLKRIGYELSEIIYSRRF